MIVPRCRLWRRPKALFFAFEGFRKAVAGVPSSASRTARLISFPPNNAARWDERRQAPERNMRDVIRCASRLVRAGADSSGRGYSLIRRAILPVNAAADTIVISDKDAREDNFDSGNYEFGRPNFRSNGEVILDSKMAGSIDSAIGIPESEGGDRMELKRDGSCSRKSDRVWISTLQMDLGRNRGSSEGQTQNRCDNPGCCGSAMAHQRYMGGTDFRKSAKN